MKEKAFVSIVLYTHNNSSSIGSYLTSLDGFMDSRFENFEIIIVDDASIDQTVSNVRNVFSSLSREVTIIKLAWRHGPENGMVSGVDLAIGDFVAEIDINKADYDLNLIYDMYQEVTRGNDIVSARSQSQKISDLAYFTVFNRVSYLPFKVVNESVRVVSRRAINAILDMNERVIYRGILYRFSGFPSKTMIYTPVNTNQSPGLSFREKARLALDIMASYSNIGTNVSVVFALGFAILSVLLGMYALIVRFTFNSVVPGWTTTILFMSACFFGVFLVIGLQGRYISAIINDIKNRPTYTINSIERSSKQNTEAKR